MYFLIPQECRIQRLMEIKRRKPMIIKQLEAGSIDNFCYIIGCEDMRQAMVIDPGSDVERILSVADKEGLKIVKIVNTHGHGDHTAGNARLKSLTGAEIIIHALDADGYPEADILIIDEDLWQLGEITFDIIHTPGHTPGGICLYAQGNLFTGDTTAAVPISPAATARLWENPSAA
jgi:hydroxyacylglutathione hydrolase